MQKFFKIHKMLIGIIGLAMLGTDNAQAISSPNKRASAWSGAINTVSVSKVSDSFVQEEPAKYVGKDGIAVSSYPPTFSIKVMSQHDVKSVEDGWPVGGPGTDALLSAQVYRYGDILKVAVRQADSVAMPVPFHSDAVSADMLSIKVSANENLEASPVPLPAAAWSFLIGLLGILGLKKRKSPPSETS